MTTSVLADQLWWKKSPHGERFMDAYIFGGSLVTFFLVSFLSDDIASTILIVIMNTFVLGVALYVEMTRTNHSWWWFMRGCLAACLILIGGILKVVGNMHSYSYSSVKQSDSYYEYHSTWHVFMSLGSLLFATLLDDLVAVTFRWTLAPPSKVVNYSKI